MKYGILFLALLAISHATTSHACLEGASPINPVERPEAFMDAYPVIFIGTVIGIQLDGYEKRLKMQYDKWLMNEDLAINPSTATPQHTLTILVREVIRGEVDRKMEVVLGGCSAQVPHLKWDGLFLGDFGIYRRISGPVPTREGYPDIRERRGEIYKEFVSNVRELVRQNGELPEKSDYYDKWLSETKAEIPWCCGEYR